MILIGRGLDLRQSSELRVQSSEKEAKAAGQDGTQTTQDSEARWFVEAEKRRSREKFRGNPGQITACAVLRVRKVRKVPNTLS